MPRISVDFIADGSGDCIIFSSHSSPSSVTIDNVSLRQIVSPAVEPNFSVKEFLTGTTDEGNPIFFRVDTQPIQFSEHFEQFSTPLSVVNRTHRGTLLKCFVSLDDEDFYEIQGTVSKGVSSLKVHSRDKKGLPMPPIAREIRLSFRDSSKQLCRLIQTSIIFTPGSMDYSE